MKIRTDFVTNSSSSSFMLAHKNSLSDATKEALVQYVMDTFLGEEILSVKDTAPADVTPEMIKKVSWFNPSPALQEDIQKALAEGLDIFCGNVDYEQAEIHLAAIYSDVWKILSDTDAAFEVIRGDLSY